MNFYQNLNEIFNDGTTSIIAIKTFHHASLLPPEIKEKWCICKMKERFDDFLPQCGAYLLIKTPLLEKRYKNVIAIVNDNNIEYWDSNNQRMSYITRDEEEELIKYEEMLSDTAVEKINTYNEMNENENKNITINI